MTISSLIDAILANKKPHIDVFIESLSPYLDQLPLLKQTPQDSKWHQEGNVYIHTSMVLENVYELLEKEELDLSNQEILALVFSAVLHDIAKPFSTKTQVINDVERIVAPYHEEKGASYLSYKICSIDLDYTIIQNILRLVAYHHIPKKLILKNAQQGEFFKLARKCNLKLLYLLAKADMLGRICEDKAHQLDLIDLFKIKLEELGLFVLKHPYKQWQLFYEQNYSDLSPLSKEALLGYAQAEHEEGLIYTKEEAIARRYPYLKSFSHLVIMCGPSGSGKSSFILKKYKDYVLISLDQIRKEKFGNISHQKNNREVIQIAKELLKEALRKRQNVVWDATNLKKDFRSMLFGIGKDYKAYVTLIVLHCSIETIIFQNKSRVNKVDIDVINDQIQNIEWPNDDEAHKTCFVYKGSIYNF
jgi:predicted kinase